MIAYHANLPVFSQTICVLDLSPDICRGLFNLSAGLKCCHGRNVRAKIKEELRQLKSEVILSEIFADQYFGRGVGQKFKPFARGWGV